MQPKIGCKRSLEHLEVEWDDAEILLTNHSGLGKRGLTKGIFPLIFHSPISYAFFPTLTFLFCFRLSFLLKSHQRDFPIRRVLPVQFGCLGQLLESINLLTVVEASVPSKRKSKSKKKKLEREGKLRVWLRDNLLASLPMCGGKSWWNAPNPVYLVSTVRYAICSSCQC